MTPDDSARNRKMRKMMSLNCSIGLMPIFGVGKVYRIWTPKGGPPQYDIFNGCHKLFGNLPQNRPESSVLDSMIVRYKVPYLDGVLVMQYQFWVPNCDDSFVRQQRHS